MPVDTELPLPYDIQVYRGDTYRLRVQINDSAGAPYDLTGTTITAHIKRARGIPAVLADLHATADADQVTNKGFIDLELNPEDYQLMPHVADNLEIGVWDLEVTWPSGDVTTYLTGIFTLEGDVS